MKLLVDVDGPLLDVQPAYWLAYQRGVSELRLARIDPAAFWRLVRCGAPEGELLRGSKPRHWKLFREQFALLLDTDEAVARMLPQPEAGRLTSLGPGLSLQIVTLHANAPARHRVLAAAGRFEPAIVSLSGPVEDRVRRLAALADGEERSLVLAGHDQLVRAACDAGLPCVGIANGPRTARCLTRAGAAKTFPDLDEFLDHLQSATDASEVVRL